MINVELNYLDLLVESENRGMNVLRLIFDKYIYTHISKAAFDRSGRGHNNSIIQIEDHGTDTINVAIKTNKASRRYLVAREE